MKRIERTSLWNSTLAFRADDQFQQERETLRGALIALRKNTGVLVAKIADTLPELTQHDITHLDALWETASLIIGADFPLTPLEGFVLGGAFLLHDSALCFEAFENGREGLRSTNQWKDVFAELSSSSNESLLTEREHQADFAALRTLHAYQAENLLNRSWKVSPTDIDLFLLENQELRTHLGKLIGQIASSHHWDIETVISTFNTQQNVPTGYPVDWRIDPIKLACILRCADAAHIDNERAPDFLYALLKRSGVSKEHWKSQNRLAKVDVDQSDITKSTLLFTSTIDFTEADSNAWFVAYDAICLVDKEIKSCNSVLEKKIAHRFMIQKVQGVESPERLAKFVKAAGWTPCSAKVHVGNVEKIIQNLGGEMLYGAGADNLGVVLREMIQNSRDSIKARAVFEDDFEGKIVVKLKSDSVATWLTIEDNGIGMSERVLTGPLLDFGTSFWTSSLIRSEFPGLRSSKFKSIGKFGIGFYSVFMISEQVYITSKNFTSGISDICQLKFPNGFSLRPILSKDIPIDFSSYVSTQIKLKLKPNLIPDNLFVEIKTNKMGSFSFKVPLKDYIAAYCAGLDVPVFYQENDNPQIKIHENIQHNDFNKIEWLTKISFADYHPNPELIKSYISKNISRLKPILEDGITLGYAAISTKDNQSIQDFLSIDTVGGLAYTIHHRDGDKFIGFMDYFPKSAKREMGLSTASQESITLWASEQLKELLTLDLSPSEKYVASSALCGFKIDPSELALILTAYNGGMFFLSFKQLAALATEMPIAFLTSIRGNHHIETYHNIQYLKDYALIRPITNTSFLSLKLIDGIPEHNFSILDCLYRAILQNGKSPLLQEVNNLGVDIFGQSLKALVISSN